MFYKIRALHSAGLKIILHTFKYGRKEQQELLKYCTEVHYYKRLTGITNAMSKKPYIVVTRASKTLLNNLLKDDSPIIFEGLHTTYYIDHEKLKGRKKLVRTHNVEHDYYKSLSEIEKKRFRRMFFEEEAKKLKKYESVLNHADHIMAISENDFIYFNNKYENVSYIPAFHQNEGIKIKTGKGKYILFHGNLSVGENINAVTDLIENVFSKIDIPVVIAGRNPDQSLVNLIRKYKKISLISNPFDQEMSDIISNAHVIILFTDQNTGIKLKLLSSLYNGRFIIANKAMVENTGLADLCTVIESHDDAIRSVNYFMDNEFPQDEINKRADILLKYFSNKLSAELIVNLL